MRNLVTDGFTELKAITQQQAETARIQAEEIKAQTENARLQAESVRELTGLVRGLSTK